MPLTCNEVAEEFKEKFYKPAGKCIATGRPFKGYYECPCCFDCHSAPDIFPLEIVVLSNGWTAEVCCGMKKFVKEKMI